jgi:hypothetical protein
VAVPHPLGISIRYRCAACGTAWEYVLDGVSRTIIEFNRLTDIASTPVA